MLSFIVRLVELYEREHGHRPNVVYLNADHLKRLREDLFALDASEMAEQLGLHVIQRSDSVHPQVSWIQTAARAAG